MNQDLIEHRKLCLPCKVLSEGDERGEYHVCMYVYI
jgi:hypothetical protein